VKINAAGLEMLKRFEQCRLQSYRCPAGKWTVGWGHTGEHVTRDTTLTQHQADEILASDLERFERAVELLAPGANENQFSALVSFAFNCGEGRGGLAGSLLLKQFLAGEFDKAAHEFCHWIRVRGEVMPGLIRRRAAEAALFLTPVNR
jgi:lysozyme